MHINPRGKPPRKNHAAGPSSLIAHGRRRASLQGAKSSVPVALLQTQEEARNAHTHTHTHTVNDETALAENIFAVCNTMNRNAAAAAAAAKGPHNDHQKSEGAG